MALSSCAIIESYALDCRTGAAGIQTLYVTELENVASVTASSGIITAMALSSGKKLWQIDLVKEDAQWTEKSVVNVQNGTVFSEQTLVFTMHKMTARTRNFIKILTQRRLVVVAKMVDGESVLLGQTRGMDVTDVTAGSGKAMGDLNGNVITLMGKENDPPQYFQSSSIYTALL